MLSIDINSDVGEGFGLYRIGDDNGLMDFVTSVNIACGFHAGDPVIIENTVKMAIKKGISIGAHPGFNDLLGFGRRNMKISLNEVRSIIIYQIGALYGFVKAGGGKLNHVKPHGALYNMAAIDYELAKTIAKAVFDVDKNILFYGLANSMLLEAAKDVGLKTVSEVFADRSYNDDGSLVSREDDKGLIIDREECAKRVIRIIRERKVSSVSNKDIHVYADSVCVHGDTPNAILLASFLKKSLLLEGIEVCSIRK